MFLTLSCFSCLVVLTHTKEASTIETLDTWHVEFVRRISPKSRYHEDSHDRRNPPARSSRVGIHPLPTTHREHAEVPFAPLLLASRPNARSRHAPASLDNRPRHAKV